MNVEESYSATRTIPGLCLQGDLFILYEDGSVDHVTRLAPDAEKRIKLHRSALRRLDHAGGPHAARRENAPEGVVPIHRTSTLGTDHGDT